MKLTSIRRLLWIGIALLGQHALAAAPLHRLPVEKRVSDTAGKVLYTVELRDEAMSGQSDWVDPRERERFASRHGGHAVNAVRRFEREYGFRHEGMTSWTGLSFGAFLTPAQVARLQDDPHVTSIHEVAGWTFGAQPASPPWFDWAAGDETYSWGHAAIGGISIGGTDPRTGASTAPPIYVIDAGVGNHVDLPNIRQLAVRASIAPVGCYPHATHVAGIIAATVKNGGGSAAGVIAGAPITSVPAVTFNKAPAAGSPVVCADVDPQFPSVNDQIVGEAIDAVRADLATTGKVGVVNISMNRGQLSWDPAGFANNNSRLVRLATPDPATGYRGAVVVQSAGNAWENACFVSYSNASFRADPADGILVVGGIDAKGQMVAPPNPSDLNATGYNNFPFAGNERGSNRGPCVDLWAPSTAIRSTWGPTRGYDPSVPDTWQSQFVTYSNYVNLSGTSMAAPYVSGVAAAILQRNPGLTPAQVEQQIRAAAFSTGQVDTSFDCAALGGCPVRTVTNPVAILHDNPLTSRLANISTRSWVGTGNDVLIGSFVAAGGGKTVVIHGRGPALGVQGALANPVLTLVHNGVVIASNDDWQQAANASQLAALGFGLPDPHEAAILITLPEGGAYSAILSGAGNTVGVGLVAVYEVDHPEIELIGLATRGFSNSGDGVMIGGIIVQPAAGLENVPRTVLVRVRGPSLAAAGIGNPLPDPLVTFVPGNGEPPFAVNNWADLPGASEVNKLAFGPPDPRDVAFLATLRPNVGYTVIVQGVGGTTGVALFEVYPQ